MGTNLGAYKLVFKPYGESALLIEWPKKIDKNILIDIRLFVQRIEHENIKQIIDINYVYSSLLVVYNNNLIKDTELKNILVKLYYKVELVYKTKQIRWKIPVCYHENFGIDLQLLASEKNCTIAKLIELHTSINYTVFGIGFLPGFLYLGGLPKLLHYPRKSSPRLKVPKGSVAIGGDQTGIYPQNSPGGWNIIGETPVSLFDINQEYPIEIKPGDEIKFYSISITNFKEIENRFKKGVYNLEKEVLND